MSDTPDAATGGQTEPAEAAAATTSTAPLRLLKKDQFLKRDDVRYVDEPVPEWAEDGVVPIVRMRSLSGAEKDELENQISKQGADGVAKTEIRGLRAKFLVKVIVDEQGRRIFDDSDAGQLAQKNAAALERLFAAGTKLSRFLQINVEEEVKN